MGRFDLPVVDKIKTPGFIHSLDGALETKCICGGFTTAGATWRMWLIYTFQIFFLFLAVVIGANIQVGLGSLGGTYDAVDILRLIGGIPGIVAALMGGVGVYIRMKYLLMGNVVLNTIAILFSFLAWAIDAADAADAASRVGTGAVAGGTAINFTGPRDKAATACFFGALGWIFTIIAFYLTYAYYQEMDNPNPSTPGTVEMGKPNYESQYTGQPSVVAVPIQRPMQSPVMQQQQPAQRPIQAQPQAQAKPKQAQVSKSQLHNCPQCNTEWPIDVKFCGECGSKIPDKIPEQVPTTAPSELWEEHFTEDGYMYYYNPKTGESKWAES